MVLGFGLIVSDGSGWAANTKIARHQSDYSRC